MSWIDKIIENLPKIQQLCRDNLIISLKMFPGISSENEKSLNLVFTEEIDVYKAPDKYTTRIMRLRNGITRLLGWKVSIAPEKLLRPVVADNVVLINLFPTQEDEEQKLKEQLKNTFGEQWQFTPAGLDDTTISRQINMNPPSAQRLVGHLAVDLALKTTLNAVECEIEKLPAESHAKFFLKLYETVAIDAAISAISNQLEIQSQKLPIHLREIFFSRLTESLQKKIGSNICGNDDSLVGVKQLSLNQKKSNSATSSTFFQNKNHQSYPEDSKNIDATAEENEKSIKSITS